jgi:hypothetical protein
VLFEAGIVLGTDGFHDENVYPVLVTVGAVKGVP